MKKGLKVWTFPTKDGRLESPKHTGQETFENAAHIFFMLCDRDFMVDLKQVVLLSKELNTLFY